MKISIPFIAFLLIGIISTPKYAHSQIIPQVGLLTEFTQSGVLVGGYAGASFGKRLSAGGFYEARTKEFDTDLNEDLSVYGAYFGYTILQEKKLSFGLLLRTGLSSNKFFFVAPSVSFGYKFNVRFNAVASAGFRYERNYSAIGISYNIVKSEK